MLTELNRTAIITGVSRVKFALRTFRFKFEKKHSTSFRSKFTILFVSSVIF